MEKYIPRVTHSDFYDMPIKPENKPLYPKNWKEISLYIRHQRAKNRCENCGVHNHSVGYRDHFGKFNPCYGNLILEDYGQGIDPNTGGELLYNKARDWAYFETENDELGNKYIVIVLTVAHLDHNPKNCVESNLLALCQQCHNRYDIAHRKDTKRKSELTLSLFPL